MSEPAQRPVLDDAADSAVGEAVRAAPVFRSRATLLKRLADVHLFAADLVPHGSSFR